MQELRRIVVAFYWQHRLAEGGTNKAAIYATIKKYGVCRSAIYMWVKLMREEGRCQRKIQPHLK